MRELLPLLCRSSGMARHDVERIIRTAPRRYKVYEIPKRSGGKREIAQPSRELKFLQRILVQEILVNLPVHPAATAYFAGAKILSNATLHAGGAPILKMDFKDFFPSIHGVDWLRYCREKSIFSDDDAVASANLLFRKVKGEKTLKLSIGAPSSPVLSNILLFNFDSRVAAEANRRKITYSRYADDMTFSGQRIGMLKDMLEVVARAARFNDGPKLTLNKDKTNYVTTKHQRKVTGLVLSNDGSVGVGRDKRRIVRAKVHHVITGKLPAEERAELLGYLLFINDVEPEFLRRLNEYYRCDVLARVRGEG